MVLNKSRSGLKPIFIFIMALVLVTFYSGFISFPSVLKYVYGAEFPITITQANLLTSVYLATYFIFQIPAGLVIDRLKVHQSIFVCVSLLLISLISFVLAKNFMLFLIARIVMGVAVSFSFLLTIYIAKSFFSSRHLTLLVGLAELIFSLALAFTPYAVSYLSDLFGWQFLPLVLMAVLLLVSIIYIVFGLHRYRTIETSHELPLATKTVPRQLADIFSCGWFWYILFVVGIFYAHFALYTEIYAPTYIQRMYGANYDYSIFLNDAAIMGYMLGCLSLGFVAQLIEIRRLFFIAIVASALIFAVNLFGDALLAENFVLRYLDYCLLGYFAAYSMLIFRLYEVISGKALTASISAALNMFNLVPLLFVSVYQAAFDMGSIYERIFIFASYSIALFLMLPLLMQKAHARHGSDH